MLVWKIQVEEENQTTFTLIRPFIISLVAGAEQVSKNPLVKIIK